MKKIVKIGFCFILVFFIFSCATEVKREDRIIPRYYGRGTADSMVKALSLAKKEALQQAVLEMIGTASEAAHRGDLENLVYSPDTLDAFVKSETVEVITREEKGGTWETVIRTEVDLLSLEKVLRANSIFGSKVTPGSALGSGAEGAKGNRGPSGMEKDQTIEPEEAVEEYPDLKEEDEEPGVSQELTGEEREFIDRYVERMTYMVYFNEDTEEDPFLMKSAVTIANKTLADSAVPVIDLDQFESIKKDREIAFEEQTGQDVSIIQWIAQRLNADVYIEIDAETSGEKRNEKYYGQANITLKVFDASTAALLGSVPYNSPRTFSTSSILDAKNNALQSSIYKAMPMALNQAQVYMKKALEQGIKYLLIMQNTQDAKLMSSFRRKMRSRCKEIRTISASPEETAYEVYLFGTIEDLEDLVFDVAEAIPGLENVDRVFLRGRSITFDTGF